MVLKDETFAQSTLPSASQIKIEVSLYNHKITIFAPKN